jgi:hypothetical protein
MIESEFVLLLGGLVVILFLAVVVLESIAERPPGKR